MYASPFSRFKDQMKEKKKRAMVELRETLELGDGLENYDPTVGILLG